MAQMRNVHQFVTGATPGNAIMAEAQVMQAALQAWGYSSHIFAERIHATLQRTVRPYTAYRPSAGDLLLFHYSLGSDLSDFVLGCAAPLLLRYHNVTPARYLAGAHPWLRAGAEKGRRDLPRFAARTALALADSPYNAQELIAAGFANTAVLPLIQPTELYEAAPDTAVLSRFRDGRTNLLFVGRIAPNKRQEDLLKALYFYRQIDPQARLLLVGSEDGAGQYGRWLRGFVQQFGLQEAVHFGGHVSTAQLAAYYRAADVFVCLSEHEGFCQPLVESMMFDVPILAFAETAVPGTLGNAGVMVTAKQFPVIAELIHLLVTDAQLRQEVIAGQQARRQAFAQDALLQQFRRILLQRMLSE